MATDGTPPLVSRKAWYWGAGTGILLFGLLIANDFTGVWPQPWLALELLVLIACILIGFMCLAGIIATHPLAPRSRDQSWIWSKCSPRFVLLCLSLCLVPLGAVVLAAVWKQSHGWALPYGLGGTVAAVIAYWAGRPWPAYK